MDPTLLLTTLATLAALIALWQTYRANRLAAQIAERQGLLNAADVRVELFGQADPNILFALPFTPGRLFEVPAPVVLKNCGGKTARELQLFLRVPKRLIYGGSSHAVMIIAGDADGMTVKSVAQTEHIETILISLTALHPGVSHQVMLRFAFPEQTLREATTSHPASVPYRALYAYLIEALLTQADTPTSATRYQVEVVDTSQNTIPQFFAKLEDRKRRSFLRFRRRSVFLGNVRVFSLSSDQVDRDADWPIDRSCAGAMFVSHVGLRWSDGYFIPGVGVSVIW